MTLVCSKADCKTINNYSEQVILGLFINGVQDMELQQDLLAEQEKTLDKAIKLAVARETAKRSPELNLFYNKVSSNITMILMTTKETFSSLPNIVSISSSNMFSSISST